ncbi:Mg transporter [Schizophyllum fasciatum]
MSSLKDDGTRRASEDSLRTSSDDIPWVTQDDELRWELNGGTYDDATPNPSTRDISPSSFDETAPPYDASTSPLGAHHRTRGSERIPPRAGGLLPHVRYTLWPQVKSIVVEAAPTLLLTTLGLLLTGELLDRVSRWPAMQRTDQLIMIIPVVLNLKGNLEMNLSARLGTAANAGLLDAPRTGSGDERDDMRRDTPTRREIILGNLALLQVQAAVVSVVAACVSVVLGMVVPRNGEAEVVGEIVEGGAISLLSARRSLLGARRPLPSGAKTAERKSGFPTFVFVAATATSSAALSAALLGSFMCSLVLLCRHLNLDPDNIAPPVASCLGDLVTLILIGAVSSALLPTFTTTTPALKPFGIPLIPLLVFAAVLTGALACLTALLRRFPHVRPRLREGWAPLFGAMAISSATGIVLDLFVSRYEDFAVLAVVISGLPGSVGAIFVSRLGTGLHVAAEGGKGRGEDERGLLADEEEDGQPLLAEMPTPIGRDEYPPSTSAFAKPSALATKMPPPPLTVALTLLIITLPVELVFLTVVRGLGWLQLPILFVGSSVVFFCMAVAISLFIAYHLTAFLWARGLDPDSNALPLHSSFMDLVGQLLLVLCFEIVSAMGVVVETRG